MDAPYHVSCDEESVPLYRLGDGRFQLTKDGPIVPLMSGTGYFLIEEPFAAFLEELGIYGIKLEKATIWHRRLNVEHSTHKLLIVNQCFTPETIGELDTSGEKFFSLYNRYLFASPRLKKRLESGPFGYLKFTEGLDGFA